MFMCSNGITSSYVECHRFVDAVLVEQDYRNISGPELDSLNLLIKPFPLEENRFLFIVDRDVLSCSTVNG